MPAIYAIVGEQTRRVKLGFTSGTIEARMSRLQLHSPDKLRILAWAPRRPRIDERWIHSYFAGHRLHGEWFSPYVTTMLEHELAGSTFEQVLDRVARLYDTSR